MIKEKVKSTIEKFSTKLNKSTSFFWVLLRHLKEDKLYLVSFLATIFFFGYLGFMQIRSSDGMIDTRNKVSASNKAPETVIVPVEEANLEKNTEKPDVSDYVGIYSKNVTLDNVISINDTCQISSYKYVYQVKKDGTISKYFYSSCIGSILVWKDSLVYNYSGGAKYIAANGVNFTFYENVLREVDGDKYSIDEEIFSIKEDKVLEEANLSFYGNNIVFMTNTNLILIKNGKVSSPIDATYTNQGGNLVKRFYKSENIKYQYNFIVFYNNEEISCYNETFENEEPLYSIYNVRYDVSSNNFLDIKEVASRSKSNSCTNYKSDLELLKE